MSNGVIFILAISLIIGIVYIMSLITNKTLERNMIKETERIISTSKENALIYLSERLNKYKEQVMEFIDFFINRNPEWEHIWYLKENYEKVLKEASFYFCGYIPALTYPKEFKYSWECQCGVNNRPDDLLCIGCKRERPLIPKRVIETTPKYFNPDEIDRLYNKYMNNENNNKDIIEKGDIK